MPTAEFVAHKQTPDEFFRSYLPKINPELARRIQDIELVDEVHVIPNYSYQVRGFCGKGFICIGDAHRFVDPIFSFGLSASLREAEFAIPHVVAYLNGEGRDQVNPFDAHQRFCEKATDNLEDMIDLFWEQPFAFSVFVHQRYRPELIDAFAGRVYETEHQPSKAILRFRELLKRERDYVHPDDYSIPIGSRYHPERAALWAPDSVVETTEEWMHQGNGQEPDEEENGFVALRPVRFLWMSGEGRFLNRRELTGFNISGVSAGQTVAHVGLHRIPRRSGDTPNPRGGVPPLIRPKVRYDRSLNNTPVPATTRPTSTCSRPGLISS